jgi:hypothetical protein
MENEPQQGSQLSSATGFTRPPTYGEKAVGLTFNPSNDTNVQKVKELYAQIIDLLLTYCPDEKTGEKVRAEKIAITEAQTAQMWAVKAITWKD